MKQSISILVSGALFAASVGTTVYVGSLHDPVHKLHSSGVAGLTYAIILLGILGIHELGHFAAARWRRIAVSFPVFLPSPIGLGTFGAFVRLRSPVWDRSDSFDIGAAGPIAGLAVAVPLMIYSLLESAATFSPAYPHAMRIQSSFLLSILYKLVKGDSIPAEPVGISDLGFASWIVIFISALNLLPVGPLDGGRISSALFGCKRTTPIELITIAVSLLMAVFVWAGLLIWTLLLVIFALVPKQQTLDEFTAPSAGRYVLGAFLLIFALLVLLPTPGGAQLATFICPYM